MEIELRLNDYGRGKFVLVVEGAEIGEMDVQQKDGILTVYHTEVAPEAEGKGYARKLLDRMVAYVRENNLKVKAICPYVSSVFRKHPEAYSDIALQS
jgi:predicted GNAT family acetyltransferase